MHPVLARIPFIRRLFYQLEVVRLQLDRALLGRNAAIHERNAFKSELLNAAASHGTDPFGSVAGASAESRPPSQRWCVFCQEKVEGWVPFSIRVSDFVMRIGPIGSNIERFGCPRCGSTDRERHLRLFFERLHILEPIRGGSVLHMAPEPRLGEFVRGYNPSLYVKGDLFPSDESIQRIDLEQIPFSDETFDMVICNHMLEHVDDPEAVLRQLHRVLKPGARIICQTPFAARLTKTLEEPLLQSPDDRLFFYGQEDHLRFFGRDIEQIITKAGFVGRLVPHVEILPEIDPESFGVNEKEPFFDFVRAHESSRMSP